MMNEIFKKMLDFKMRRNRRGYTPVRGNLHIVLRDENGRIKREINKRNLVVTTGKALIAERMLASPSKGAITHMALGTGGTTPVFGDTVLETEIDRNALDTATRSGAALTYTASWAAGDGTGAITEAGLFNAASAGDLLARQTFSVINKGASDTLQITWQITIT